MTLRFTNQWLPPLREATSVEDLIERDRLVRRAALLRKFVVETKALMETWNRVHPHLQPIDTEYEDAFIAYLDGKGPMPMPPHIQIKLEGR